MNERGRMHHIKIGGGSSEIGTFMRGRARSLRLKSGMEKSSWK